jgi:signal transduction histidine kinase
MSPLQGRMRLTRRLRALPLRAKVAVTFVGVVTIVLGASTYISFRYWQREFEAASEQQVVLAAASTRAAVESTLTAQRTAAARNSLVRLVTSAPVTAAPVSAARVYGPDGSILLSADATEEGTRPGHAWIPDPRELPREGVLKPTASGDTVRAYLPLSLSGQRNAILEIELPVGSLRTAMERGALLGHGLMVVSFIALGIIVVTLLEREVVDPLRRMEHALADTAEDGELRGEGDVVRLERSVHRLIERGREAEERAAAVDRQRAEQEGLAEVGELAAEMAHEFKRPLASIRTAMDLLEQEYELERGGKEMLHEVDHQLDRLSDTMRDLFSLAKPVVLERNLLALDEAVDAALLEARCLREGIDVRREFEPDLPQVEGDLHRLEQAFLNLVCNAAEAMPHGGTLTIHVSRNDRGDAEVVFRDTGAGIPPEEVEKALKPFYSTKPSGTGLGLPLVMRIVRAHGGRLEVVSSPGAGTTVRVILPAASEAAGREPGGTESGG